MSSNSYRSTGRTGDTGGISIETLRYDQSVIGGNFKCTSVMTGIKCVSTSTGRGGRMSRAGVVPVLR